MYKRYQPILFVYLSVLSCSTRRPSYACEANYRHKNDIQYSPPPEMYTPIPYLRKKNFRIIFKEFIFFKQRYNGEGIFRTLGVRFPFRLASLATFIQFKVSAAMMSRIVQIFQLLISMLFINIIRRTHKKNQFNK